jgi:hypothetical protein
MDTIDTLITARVPKSLLTTLGDLIYATGAAAAARLGIGTAGQVLTVASGAPTWVTPPGAELAYVEFTSAVNSTTATEAAPLDVVSSGSITFDGTPVVVEFYCQLLQNNGSATTGISLWEDAADKGRLFDSGGAILNSGSGVFKRKITPSAGSHTYKARLWTAGGINMVANAGSGGAGTRLPGFIRITKV